MDTKRILIADDKDLLRKNLKETLIEKGFDVVGEAVTGKEAIDLNQRLKPDLIFMDVKMPELNGIEASIEINLYHPAPIILLTAKDDLHTIEKAKAAGVMAYLVKPFNEKELVPAIEIAIARFKEFTSLVKENADLKQSLEARKSIEKAKGVLMKKQDISEQEAFRKMQKLSMDKQTSMQKVAKSIIITAEL